MKPSLILALSLLLALPACAHDPIDSMQGYKKASEARLATAAADAIAAGETKEALIKYDKLYAKSPSKRDVALNYAQLLRKSGETEMAVKVLSKFSNNAIKDDLDAVILNEYAAAMIETGQFATAEQAARRVIDDRKVRAQHADSYNLMGIARDAQGDHAEAEKLFRLSLEHWKGDASSVMNNLALNLAGQGKFDESLTLLRKALVIAPKKKELAKNIEIVTAIRATVVPKAPVNLAPKAAKGKKGTTVTTTTSTTTTIKK